MHGQRLVTVWFPDELMMYERAAAEEALAARGHRGVFGPLDAEADAIVTGGPALTSASLAKLGKRGVAVRFARGRYDVGGEPELCRAAGIRYQRIDGRSAQATAEHAIALMLALLRRLGDAAHDMRAGEWTQRELAERGIYDLGEATVGLVGLGAVGRHAARLLNAFGATVLYVKPNRLPADEEGALGVTFAELDELLARADILSLHARLRDGVAAPIGAEQLDRLRAGALVVNTGDGRHLDLDALLERVRAGRLAAGLDVFPAEPWPHDAIDAACGNRLLLTPHVAGRSVGTARRLFRNAVAALDEQTA